MGGSAVGEGRVIKTKVLGDNRAFIGDESAFFGCLNAAGHERPTAEVLV